MCMLIGREPHCVAHAPTYPMQAARGMYGTTLRQRSAALPMQKALSRHCRRHRTAKRADSYKSPRKAYMTSSRCACAYVRVCVCRRGWRVSFACTPVSEDYCCCLRHCKFSGCFLMLQVLLRENRGGRALISDCVLAWHNLGAVYKVPAGWEHRETSRQVRSSARSLVMLVATM